jgi:transcriptional regulator with XRE-family HTH domain
MPQRMPSQELTSPGLPVGRRIEEAAAERKMQWAELARRVGVTESLLYKWRKGWSVPSTPNLQRLAAELDKPLSYFFSEDGAEAA